MGRDLRENRENMSTQIVVPNSVTPLSFKTVSVASERKASNAKKESKDERVARAKAFFRTGGISYNGHLPDDARTALAVAHPISVPDLGIVGLSITNKTAAKCLVCNLVHNLENPDLSAKITFYTKDKKTFALSDTCRDEILTPMAGEALTKDSLVQYRKDFPPVVKRG